MARGEELIFNRRERREHKDMKIAATYAFFDPQNPKKAVYVGKSSDVFSRVATHIKDGIFDFRMIVIDPIPQRILSIGKTIAEQGAILSFYEAMVIADLKPFRNEIIPDPVVAFGKTPKKFQEIVIELFKANPEGHQRVLIFSDIEKFITDKNSADIKIPLRRSLSFRSLGISTFA